MTETGIDVQDGPTWYDVLGLDRSATSDEIRRAWRSMIADLDPTDPRFKAGNAAAEVLLDPDRRAAYDAGLAPAEEVDRATEPSDEPAAGHGPTVPGWLVAVLAVVTGLLLVLCGWLASQPSSAEIEDALGDAQVAADRALPTILAYDHRTLEEDRAAATELMTPEYAEEYDRLFDAIARNAPKVKPVVEAEVIASSIVRGDAERVSVFVFVDQVTRNAQTPADGPGTSWRNSVTVTMAKVGDEWLVDALETNTSTEHEDSTAGE